MYLKGTKNQTKSHHFLETKEEKLYAIHMFIVLKNETQNLQIAIDDAQRLAKHRLEREKGRHDAAEDLSELSEGEKEKGETQQANKISRINSEMQIWSDVNNKSRQLYIVLIR